VSRRLAGTLCGALALLLCDELRLALLRLRLRLWLLLWLRQVSGRGGLRGETEPCSGSSSDQRTWDFGVVEAALVGGPGGAASLLLAVAGKMPLSPGAPRLLASPELKCAADADGETPSPGRHTTERAIATRAAASTRRCLKRSLMSPRRLAPRRCMARHLVALRAAATGACESSVSHK